MMRVSGSSGDSQGFHRESDEDATKIKLEPGIEASAEGAWPQTLLSEAGYTQRLSAGRNSDDAKEEDPDMNLEEKPRPPPQAPLGAPADCDAGRDQQGEARTAQASSPNTPPASSDAVKRKNRNQLESN
ncbi:hypothetical protein PHMEG_0006244 [Phytophthora megakarya]|uniref:Uncharacterized protein n=1 Tax=Phytophthora megakarya TaxID=4795 RepID=A0A225WQZ5_9STRA|nr:hypothetical protein PHMEG_0006244 [Phytophthora megakarya]